MAVRDTIARNTVFNAAGRLFVAVVNVALMVYIVRRVGEAGYGVWGLTAAFTSYIALVDLGMGSGYAKYIAEHAARNEHREVSAVVSTGFFLYFFLGAVIIAVGWPFLDQLIDLFFVVARKQDMKDLALVEDLRFLFKWGLVLFAVANCVSAFSAVQTGLQRMGITNILSVASVLLKVAATVFFLEFGYGVRGLLYANALVLCVFAVATIATAFWLFPALRVSPWRMNRPTFRRLFGFGWRSQVSRLANLIMFETDVIIVALLFQGFGLVGLYNIGVGLANKVRQVPLLLLSALVPAASDLDARSDEERLQLLYLRATKYTAAVAIPLALFTITVAGTVTRLLFGEGYETAAWVLRIMAFGYVANTLPGAGVSVVLGKGRADLQMKAGLISMIANIVLTVALVLTVGFWGIPVATAASMFLSWAWFTRAVTPVLGVPPRKLLAAAMGWPLLASLPGTAICLVFNVFAPTATVWWQRTAVGTGLALCALAFGVAFLWIIRRTPFIDSYDAAFLVDVLKLNRVPFIGPWLEELRSV